MTAQPRLLFVFRDGFSERREAVGAGRAPAEAYGFFELSRRGVDVEAVDSSLPRARAVRALSLAWQRLYAIPRSGLGYRLDQARSVRAHARSDPHRHVLATNDSLALPLLALRVRQRLPNPVAYVSIGLCDAVRRGEVATRLARRYLRLAAEASTVFVFTSMEVELFAGLAPEATVRLLPLGIDVDWWAPLSTVDAAEPRTILSAGRDPSRSFPTLAQAVRGLDAATTVIGNLARAQGVRNENGIRLLDDVPFDRLRTEIWRAGVVAIPSRRAAYGAGQTTALQAMASARPVVMSGSAWTRDAGLRDGVHFVDVPAEDASALRAALGALLDDPDEAAAIGRRAQEAVAQRYSISSQADALLAALGGRA